MPLGHHSSLEEQDIVRRLAAIVVAVMTFALAMPAVADASQCSGGGHTLSLSNGGVSPGTGTTSTTFVFSVTYRDSANCAPDQVVVTINGLGTYPLSGAGSGYDTGVVFSRSMTIGAPGTYTYSFAASAGSKAVQLAGVLPASFQVTGSAPTPPPTPKPTPPPTPKPTPPPTPKPTPPPTPKPTPPPTPKPTPPPASATPPASGTAAPSAAASASPAPSDAPAGTASATASPTAHEPGAAGPPSGPVAGPDAGDAGAIRTATWVAVTVGGLALFLLLARRRPREDPDSPSDATLQPVPAAPSGGMPAEPASFVPREEADMPRWLRPSVQAGRRRSIRD